MPASETNLTWLETAAVPGLNASDALLTRYNGARLSSATTTSPVLKILSSRTRWAEPSTTAARRRRSLRPSNASVVLTEHPRRRVCAVAASYKLERSLERAPRRAGAGFETCRLVEQADESAGEARVT